MAEASPRKAGLKRKALSRNHHRGPCPLTMHAPRPSGRWTNSRTCGPISSLVLTTILLSMVMNTGSIALLFVLPALIIALAVALYFTTKEAGE